MPPVPGATLSLGDFGIDGVTLIPSSAGDVFHHIGDDAGAVLYLRVDPEVPGQPEELAGAVVVRAEVHPASGFGAWGQPGGCLTVVSTTGC